MKRVFYVKISGSAGSNDFLRFEVIASTAEEAIKKAQAQSKRDTGEKYLLVEELLHRGEVL